LGAQATATNAVRMGNAAITLAQIQVAWTATSDARMKQDIEVTELGLNFIGKLRPVKYRMLGEQSKKKRYGLIAQEVEKVLDGLGVVDYGGVDQHDGVYGMRYDDLIPCLINSIKELRDRVVALETKK